MGRHQPVGQWSLQLKSYAVCQIPSDPCSRGEGQANGLKIAHFPYQNNIGIFPQRGSQRLRKPQCVAVHLALINQAALTVMNKLNRILDRQDMILAAVVYMIDYCGKRR